MATGALLVAALVVGAGAAAAAGGAFDKKVEPEVPVVPEEIEKARKEVATGGRRKTNRTKGLLSQLNQKGDKEAATLLGGGSKTKEDVES